MELDQGSDESQQRAQRHQTNRGAHDIHRSLQRKLPTLEARRRQLDQWLTMTPHSRRMYPRDLR